jgi:hypothetical protein
MSCINNSQDSCCKVGKLAVEYDLDGVHEGLVARWHGERGFEAHGTRGLAEWFNTEVLSVALADVGYWPPEGQVEYFHRVLTAAPSNNSGVDDGVTTSERQKVVSMLENEGLDVETLYPSDFTSHQTIYRHLNNCLDAPKPEQDRSTEQLIANVDEYTQRLGRVSESAVRQCLEIPMEQLHDQYEFSLEPVIRCEDCSQQMTVQQFLETGECHCVADPDAAGSVSDTGDKKKKDDKKVGS